MSEEQLGGTGTWKLANPVCIDFLVCVNQSTTEGLNIEATVRDSTPLHLSFHL